MADWFKFYENDLDETRLQYAIAKLPEVVSVWVGILSECCRHKSGTVSWGHDEIELFGFSRRLGVSIPKVNEGIKLLVEIRYISKTDSKLTVIKWGAKQSEYCQKRTKQQNQAGDQNPMCRDSVGTVSGHKPESVGQEERRGEEIRGDKNHKASAKRFTTRQTELTARLHKCLNGQWENDRQKWMSRISKLADKTERVTAEVENAINEGRIKTTPAQFAEDTWDKFK